MAVPSEARSSVSGVNVALGELESSATPVEQQEEMSGSNAGVEPPPYVQASPSASTATPVEKPVEGVTADDEFALLQNSNYVYIKEHHKPIKGSWKIDPNVEVSASVPMELPEGEERANLYLRTEYGDISARLALISDGPTKSIIDVSSRHGAVDVKIVSLYFASTGSQTRLISACSVTSYQPKDQPQSQC